MIKEYYFFMFECFKMSTKCKQIFTLYDGQFDVGASHQSMSVQLIIRHPAMPMESQLTSETKMPLEDSMFNLV